MKSLLTLLIGFCLFSVPTLAQTADCNCVKPAANAEKAKQEAYNLCMKNCEETMEYHKAIVEFMLAEAKKVPNDSVSIQHLESYHTSWEGVKTCFGYYQNSYKTNQYFHSGSYQLSVQQQEEVKVFVKAISDKVACFQKKGTAQYSPYVIISVEGFADNTGSPAKNMVLSVKRAQKIAEFITQSMSLPTHLYKVVAEGKGQRVGEEDGIENWRVVMIRIYVGLSYNPG